MNLENIKKMDLATIFNMDGTPKNMYEIDMRNTEFLVLNELSLEYLDEIIFKNRDEMLLYQKKHDFNNGIKYTYDSSKFF